MCSHIGKVLQDCMQALDEQNNLITAHDDEDVCLDEETVGFQHYVYNAE